MVESSWMHTRSESSNGKIGIKMRVESIDGYLDGEKNRVKTRVGTRG
jgi:hypothetical protein